MEESVTTRCAPDVSYLYSFSSVSPICTKSKAVQRLFRNQKPMFAVSVWILLSLILNCTRLLSWTAADFASTTSTVWRWVLSLFRVCSAWRWWLHFRSVVTHWLFALLKSIWNSFVYLQCFYLFHGSECNFDTGAGNEMSSLQSSKRGNGFRRENQAAGGILSDIVGLNILLLTSLEFFSEQRIQ